jgi:DNA-3-methyladenine glycosylase I
MTVLKRREAYREAYAMFDRRTVAGWGDTQAEKLMSFPGLIHNRQKIAASIKNAKAFMNIQSEFESFDRYLLSFFGGKPLVHSHADISSIPPVTALSRLISIDMKKRGFSFMGPTVVYAHLQAAGIVDDHVDNCFKKAVFPASGPLDEGKLTVLFKAGQALKDAGVLFGIGGSAMMYFYGLAEDFRDIDLVVALPDAGKAEEVFLRLGVSCPAKNSDVFVTDVFRSFLVDGIGIDLMAGLAIRHEEGVFRYPFDASSLPRSFPVMGALLPFCALEEWCVLYDLMPGKENKAEKIRRHFIRAGARYPALLIRMLEAGVPQRVRMHMKEIPFKENVKVDV